MCVSVRTVSGDVQLHQLHEVGHLWRKLLDGIVAQAKLPEVQQPEERLKHKTESPGQRRSHQIRAGVTRSETESPGQRRSHQIIARVTRSEMESPGQSQSYQNTGGEIHSGGSGP